MSVALVDRLLEAFDELERCIAGTQEVLAEKSGVPEDVISRVSEYSRIVSKQRSLAKELKTHIEQQDWQEVGRFVRLINGLSTMIRDDAQAILSGAYQTTHTDEQEQLVC